MKTLRIIARLNIGGPARHAIVLDQGLRARGTDTLLAYGRLEAGESGLDDEARARRLKTVRLLDRDRRIRPWSDLRGLARLTRIIFTERPDVMHTHTAKAGTFGRIAAFTYNATRRRDRRCLEHERVAALGLGHAVRFAGWQRDLPAVYATFDAVVLSSQNEGTPVALIEAMAAGRAVIATEVGRVADVVENGQTGILVPPWDSHRLAEALVHVAQDTAAWRRLAAAGRLAATRYRPERLVDDIQAIYDSGLASKQHAKA